MDHDYHAMPQKKKDTSRRSWIYKATTVFLAVSLGFGVHASKESLAPAEPTLEAVGVGPIAYACLTIAPTAMSFFTPLLWGALHGYNPAAVLICAPAGELSGALLLAGGLHLLLKSGGADHGPEQWLAICMLMGGILLSSACRAGISVGECAAIGQAGRRSSTALLGFSTMVAAKHCMGIGMAILVPMIIGSTDHELNGLLRVQLWTCLLYTSPSPRDRQKSRMPSSA